MKYPIYEVYDRKRLLGRKIFSESTGRTYRLTKLQNDDRTFYCHCIGSEQNSGHLDFEDINNINGNRMKDSGGVYLLPSAEKKEFKI